MRRSQKRPSRFSFHCRHGTTRRKYLREGARCHPLPWGAAPDILGSRGLASALRTLSSLQKMSLVPSCRGSGYPPQSQGRNPRPVVSSAANGAVCCKSTHLPHEGLDAAGTTVDLVECNLANNLVAVVPARQSISTNHCVAIRLTTHFLSFLIFSISPGSFSAKVSLRDLRQSQQESMRWCKPSIPPCSWTRNSTLGH